MMSVVTIGNDLSAAALTRGLGNGKKRTSICKIGFHWKDFALMIIVTAALLVFLLLGHGFALGGIPALQELDPAAIGEALIGMGKYQFVLPFEAVSVLLLACMIGAILIARKH